MSSSSRARRSREARVLYRRREDGEVVERKGEGKKGGAGKQRSLLNSASLRWGKLARFGEGTQLFQVLYPLYRYLSSYNIRSSAGTPVGILRR